MEHERFEGERTLMRIHVGESDRWHGKALYQAIVELLRRENFSGVTVLRGVGGYGSSSIYHTEKILRLSQDLPIVIEVVESAERAMADAGLGPDDISLMVPHQANVRIIQAACQRLGIPEERTSVVIDRYGNTSSASIPLALYDAIDTGRVHEGDNLLLTGFGGGMTWASAVFRWSE